MIPGCDLTTLSLISKPRASGDDPYYWTAQMDTTE